jgi:hypothetical protein
MMEYRMLLTIFSGYGVYPKAGNNCRIDPCCDCLAVSRRCSGGVERRPLTIAMDRYQAPRKSNEGGVSAGTT